MWRALTADLAPRRSVPKIGQAATARFGHSGAVGVVMNGADGRRLSLDNLDGTADDLRYLATLTTEAGECRVGVWEYNSGLAAFVRSLANDWTGFAGERSYATIETDLTLVCRHDGRGTVGCRVTIGQAWPRQWSMTADLDFEAGAQLERIADDVELFFHGVT